MRMPARQRCRAVLAGLVTLATAAALSVSATAPAAAADTGYYVEPYQAASGNARMFRVQAPGGAWSESVHALSPGEALNNSFDTISPNGSWMVSGEWGTMNRLLVFPTPGVTPATSPS